MRNYHLNVNVQVWSDEDDTYWYLVTSEDDTGEEEILAYGQAETQLGAQNMARSEFLETLNE